MRAREFDKPNDTFVEMFSKFLPIAMKVIGIKSLPKMIFEKTVNSPDQPTFGQYVNGEHVLYVGIVNRHPNDILRTMAHELVHYKQDTEHQLNADSGMTGSPEENQANAIAGVVMRHFNKKYPEYLKIKPIVAEALGRDDMFYGGDDDSDGPRTRQDYSLTDKIDFSGMPASLIYRIRNDANRIPSGIKGYRARIEFLNKYKKYLKSHVEENFADGRNPQDKGDSARHGIRKGMSIAQLKKVRSSDSASPRKKQLAHWQINMRQGRAK